MNGIPVCLCRKTQNAPTWQAWPQKRRTPLPGKGWNKAGRRPILAFSDAYRTSSKP